MNQSVFISFMQAHKLLTDRLNATSEEIAAWVWLGQKRKSENDSDTDQEKEWDLGGLSAYILTPGNDDPSRFYFTDFVDDFDYMLSVMACSFKVDEVANFQPAERYITGTDLIKRWKPHVESHTKDFIRLMMAEEKLIGIHPITGIVEAFPSDVSLPTLKSGLFPLSAIKEIEAEQFSMTDFARTGSRNQELQQCANALAQKWKDEGKKKFTKREIADDLASSEEWEEMTSTRIETIIRKQW